MDFLKETLSFRSDSPLLFTQPYFWVFFTILTGFYSLLYKRKGLRNGYLLIMSLFFYYKTGGFFFFLLIFSTIVDYFIGHAIYRSQTKKKKKLFVALSVFVNLLVLSYFKYTFFFIESFNSIFNTDIPAIDYLASLTNSITGSNFDITSIFLPIGISFFTFQTISYTVDVYRGKVKPVDSIIDFGFYVSFFPQLVAGPIVRAAQFIPQMYQDYKLTREEMGHALFLILSGLLKKMVISDYISINFVDRVFEAPAAYSGFENLMAVYGYSIQIYCDFSGYTAIAIGVALLLGFRLPINFNAPYKATDITDFWRRWHISLSSWLRDYLYIPLGGNRRSKTRTNINLLITMLLGGLWHGANVRFLIWGGLHGIGLVIHKLWIKINPFRKKRNVFYHFFSLFMTFHFVTFLWIFFRAQTFDKAMLMIRQITQQFGASMLFDMIIGYKIIFLLIFWGLIIHWLPSQFKEACRGLFIQSPLIVKIVIIILTVFIIYQFKTAGLQPFIYFQF